MLVFDRRSSIVPDADGSVHVFPPRLLVRSAKVSTNKSSASISLNVGGKGILIDLTGVHLTGTTIDAQADAALKLAGLTVQTQASTSFQLTGATLQMSGSAQATLQGGIVMIN